MESRPTSSPGLEHMHYLDTKVTPVLEPLMIQLLIHKPADPTPFMVAWLGKYLTGPLSKPNSADPVPRKKAPAAAKPEEKKSVPPPEKREAISDEVPSRRYYVCDLGGRRDRRTARQTHLRHYPQSCQRRSLWKVQQERGLRGPRHSQKPGTARKASRGHGQPDIES